MHCAGVKCGRDPGDRYFYRPIDGGEYDGFGSKREGGQYAMSWRTKGTDLLELRVCAFVCHPLVADAQFAGGGLSRG